MSDSSHKNRISIQAFIEQIQNWQLTLARQQKKLRSLRPKLHSKILQNQIEILITQIEGQLIRYRKLKDINRIQGTGFDVILEYNENSRKFMEMMEAVGCFAEKVEADAGDGLGFGDAGDEGEGVASRTKYLEQTFTYSISKQDKYKSATYIPNRTISKQPSRKPSTKPQSKTVLAQTQSQSQSQSQTQTQKASRPKPRPHQSSTSSSLSTTPGPEIDSWQIRYQLKQIKSMMAQIQNEIKFHDHQDIEVQLSKLQHSNKKMSLEMKSLREDSQYIMTRIQKLKQQLQTEKQIQAQMIQQFENPSKLALSRSRKAKAKSQTQSVSNSRLRNNISHSLHEEEVSDWVRVRI